MRNILLSIVLLIVFSAPANAQVSVIEILKRCILVAGEIEKNGEQILLMQIDVVGKSQNSSQTYGLASGNAYKIIAIGDERIKDIDLCVYDGYGNRIGCDNDNKNVAMVTCSPDSSGKFKFTVSPYAMESGYSDGFYSLFVVRE